MAAPQIPPQSVAPLAPPPAGGSDDPEDLLFTKTWWLFFQQLLSFVSTAAATPPAPPTTASIALFDFAVTANLTLTAANTSDPTLGVAGLLMGVFLRQDATGGWTTTWNSPPFRGAINSLGVLPSTWSLLIFTSQIDPADSAMKWWLASIVTNQT